MLRSRGALAAKGSVFKFAWGRQEGCLCLACGLSMVWWKWGRYWQLHWGTLFTEEVRRYACPVLPVSDSLGAAAWALDYKACDRSDHTWRGPLEWRRRGEKHFRCVSTHGIAGCQDPSTSPGNSGRQLDEQRMGSDTGGPLPCREPRTVQTAAIQRWEWSCSFVPPPSAP